jgi:hypothetical protein
MASRHSFVVTHYADRCDIEMQRLDPQLDDPAFADKLYKAQTIMVDGKRIVRPANPSLTWHFEDLTFGIMDATTKVFFCIFPYFAR